MPLQLTPGRCPMIQTDSNALIYKSGSVPDPVPAPSSVQQTQTKPGIPTVFQKKLSLVIGKTKKRRPAVILTCPTPPRNGIPYTFTCPPEPDELFSRFYSLYVDWKAGDRFYQGLKSSDLPYEIRELTPLEFAELVDQVRQDGFFGQLSAEEGKEEMSTLEWSHSDLLRIKNGLRPEGGLVTVHGIHARSHEARKFVFRENKKNLVAALKADIRKLNSIKGLMDGWNRNDDVAKLKDGKRPGSPRPPLPGSPGEYNDDDTVDSGIDDCDGEMDDYSQVVRHQSLKRGRHSEKTHVRKRSKSVSTSPY
ncbi:hypothetical protein EDC01DRAFT_756537 [Geopyxis carbonaria]|nr:hypothetical protein EDC01DRAFT_756537 [Geopyxis carbonaria]